MEITPKFLQSLEKYLQSLHSKYHINSGGCCYVSYVIANKLRELHVRYKLVIFDWYGDDFESPLKSRKIIKSRGELYTYENTKNHYALKVGNSIINYDDCNGYKKVIIGCLSPEDIKYLYDKGNWNSYYSTKNNEKINKLINKFFDEYEE